MEKTQYPKWKYHPALEARIVADEASEKALGCAWVDSPADVCGLKCDAVCDMQNKDSETIAQEPAVDAPVRRKRGKSA